MITDFTPKEARPAPASRTFQFISDVWADIPTDIPTDQAMRVAERAIEILSTPTDAELEDQVGWVLYLALALGLACTAAYALLGASWLAWVGAACYALALVVYALMLMEGNNGTH